MKIYIIIIIMPYVSIEKPVNLVFFTTNFLVKNFTKLLTIEPPSHIQSVGWTLFDRRRRREVVLLPSFSLGLFQLLLVAVGNVWLHPLPDGEVHLFQYGVEQLDSAY